MKPRDPNSAVPSRLDQHLSLLGLDGKKLPDETTAAEANLLAAMQPEPLRLPSHSGQRKPALRAVWYFGSVALAAAALLLVIVQPQEESSPWLIKGGSSVQIFVERDSAVLSLPETSPLTPADRVKAEVLAPGPGMAFWGVSSRDGRLLSDPRWIWDNRLVFETTEKKYFQGSLQLDGVSEGEQLCVVICPADAVKDLEPGIIMEELSALLVLKPLPGSRLSSCEKIFFPLRP